MSSLLMHLFWQSHDHPYLQCVEFPRLSTWSYSQLRFRVARQRYTAGWISDGKRDETSLWESMRRLLCSFWRGHTECTPPPTVPCSNTGTVFVYESLFEMQGQDFYWGPNHVDTYYPSKFWSPRRKAGVPHKSHYLKRLVSTADMKNIT